MTITDVMNAMNWSTGIVTGTALFFTAVSVATFAVRGSNAPAIWIAKPFDLMRRHFSLVLGGVGLLLMVWAGYGVYELTYPTAETMSDAEKAELKAKYITFGGITGAALVVGALAVFVDKAVKAKSMRAWLTLTQRFPSTGVTDEAAAAAIDSV